MNKNKCLTKQFVTSEASGCLVETPKCNFAHKFGFSFVCRHPDHSKFHAHTVSALTNGDARELYDTLRRKRRDEFTANLDETSKKYFCHQTDFFGRPLDSMDLNERQQARYNEQP